jgi:hypothetical protein
VVWFVVGKPGFGFDSRFRSAAAEKTKFEDDFSASRKEDAHG